MTKTKARKKTSTTKLKAVEQSAPAPDAAPPAAAAEEPKELAPREYVARAKSYVDEANERFNLALYALQDSVGAGFFRTMDELKRHKHGKAVQDFVQKSQFALDSLSDELRIMLELPAAELAPRAEVKIPTDLSPAPAGEAKDSLVDARKHRELFGKALKMIAEKEILAAASEQYLEVLKFLKGFCDQLELKIARAEAGAA